MSRRSVLRLATLLTLAASLTVPAAASAAVVQQKPVVQQTVGGGPAFWATTSDGMSAFVTCGPTHSTAYGAVCYGLSQSYTMYGWLNRCGNYNFNTARFYPSTNWTVYNPGCYMG